MKNNSVLKALNIDLLQLKAYSTGLLQGKAYARMQSALSKTLNHLDISVPEWKLLGQLYEHGNMRLAELADYLSYDPPMVTKLAKALEKKGFVQRAADKTDERAKVITITKEGKQIVRKADPEVKKTMAKLLVGITSQELRSYIKVLSIIVDNS